VRLQLDSQVVTQQSRADRALCLLTAPLWTRERSRRCWLFGGYTGTGIICTVYVCVYVCVCTRKDIAKSPSRVPEAFSSLIRLYNQYFSHQASCHDPRPALDDPVK